MHIIAIDNLSGAQNSAAIALPNPPRQMRSAIRTEASLTGIIANIAVHIEVSHDGTTWVRATSGVANDPYITLQTSAEFVRIATTGTGGPYTAHFFAGRIGQG